MRRGVNERNERRCGSYVCDDDNDEILLMVDTGLSQRDRKPSKLRNDELRDRYGRRKSKSVGVIDRDGDLAAGILSDTSIGVKKSVSVFRRV